MPFNVMPFNATTSGQIVEIPQVQEVVEEQEIPEVPLRVPSGAPFLFCFRARTGFRFGVKGLGFRV